jgi:ABC-2 type transport system permease protein
MRWRPIAGIMLRQFYLMRGSPARVLPLFAWSSVEIVLWGLIARYLNSVSGAKLDFIPNLLGAVLFWDFFTRVMQGVTMAFFEDVWSRNFINLFATPLSLREYVAGLVMNSIVTSAVGLLIMLALALGVFGLNLLAPGVLLVAFVLILFLFGVSLGIFAISIVLRFGPASEWLIWPIPALLSPFAAVFYPVSALPLAMRVVARCLPPSYVFEGMRAILAGQPFEARLLLVAAGLAFVQIGLAGWTFARVYRYAVRRGLLARYSAESAS